ncbi:hypothetical protein LDENG_00114470 [Lucifuga dentata]|nr:hypothetical protein LDENG_00114470 [Lucifuga dentata]
MQKNHQTLVREIRNTLHEAGVDLSVIIFQSRLHEQKYRGYTVRCKPLFSHKNRMAWLQFVKKYFKEQSEFWKKVLWTDETKINLYQSDGKSKVGEKELPKIP